MPPDDAHARALAWAEHARSVRADLVEDLAAGRAVLADVVARRDEDLVGRIKLLVVLEALPGAGKVATRRRLAELGVDQDAPLATLDDAQVRVVLDAFGGPT
jgi:hypothetical protein